MRLGGCQLRNLLLRVELHQYITISYRAPRVEGYAFDNAGEVGADGDTLDCSDGADCIERDRPFDGLSGNRRHRFGWRLHRGELVRHRLELADLDEP
jgi:hypothetical protein